MYSAMCFDTRQRRLINCKNLFGCTPLRLAATAGHAQCVAHLLKEGADPNMADIKAQTPLLVAVKNKHIQCVKLLLEHGADPEGSMQCLYSPLFFSAFTGNLQAVQELVWHGVNLKPEARSECDKTPLHVAIAYHHFDCFKFLLLAGADPNHVLSPPSPQANRAQVSLHTTARPLYQSRPLSEMFILSSPNQFLSNDRNLFQNNSSNTQYPNNGPNIQNPYSDPNTEYPNNAPNTEYPNNDPDTPYPNNNPNRNPNTNSNADSTLSHDEDNIVQSIQSTITRTTFATSAGSQNHYAQRDQNDVINHESQSDGTLLRSPTSSDDTSMTHPLITHDRSTSLSHVSPQSVRNESDKSEIPLGHEPITTAVPTPPLPPPPPPPMRTQETQNEYRLAPPLHYTVKHNVEADYVRFLYECGADIYARDGQGRLAAGDIGISNNECALCIKALYDGPPLTLLKQCRNLIRRHIARDLHMTLRSSSRATSRSSKWRTGNGDGSHFESPLSQCLTRLPLPASLIRFLQMHDLIGI